MTFTPRNSQLRPANRIVDPELNFKRFLTKARIDKAINGLLGLVEGVSIDLMVNSKERAFLDMWLHDWGGFCERHPF